MWWKIVLGVVAALVALLAVGFFLLQRPGESWEALDKTYRSPASKLLDMGGGVEAHYRDEGNPNGRTILLVHGFSASLHTWEKWVALLGNEYRMVSVDLPGHGLTRAPADYVPTLENYADFVAAFADELDLGKVTIVGSSMGGGTAWHFALRHPDRIEGLVLVGASGWPDPRIDDREEPVIFKLLRNPVAGPILRRLDNTAMVRQGLEASFVDDSFVDDAMVARYVRMSRAPGHPDILLSIMSGRDARSLATKETLAKIRVPTLILHGRQDNLVDVAGATKFNDAIAGSRLIIYDDVGHIPQEEIADRSAADMRAFMHAAFPEPAAGAPLAAATP
jgi:pimeloyl-ACP methyl ester carboxylesterase